MLVGNQMYQYLLTLSDHVTSCHRQSQGEGTLLLKQCPVPPTTAHSARFGAGLLPPRLGSAEPELTALQRRLWPLVLTGSEGLPCGRDTALKSPPGNPGPKPNML